MRKTEEAAGLRKDIPETAVAPPETFFRPANWDVLPCDGIFKLSRQDDPITYTKCRAAYWECPNTSCIMKLV